MKKKDGERGCRCQKSLEVRKNTTQYHCYGLVKDFPLVWPLLQGNF